MKVLVLVDCQKDFMDKNGALYVPNAESIKENILNIDFNSYDILLVTADQHNGESYHKTEESKLFPPHCIMGADGSCLINGLTVHCINHKEAHLIIKKTFNVWDKKDFLFFVDENLSRNDEIHFAGVATNYCVYYAVEGFHKIGYKKLTILPNVTKGIHDDTYKKAIKTMKSWGVKGEFE